MCQKSSIVKAITLLTIICIGLVLDGCATATPEKGTLKGKVAIGPLTPVQKPGETPKAPCEIYQARKVVVYDQDRQNLIKQIDIDCNGNYTTELEPGVYTVDINHVGIDRSGDVPRKIEIESDRTLELDINIDTGIR